MRWRFAPLCFLLCSSLAHASNLLERDPALRLSLAALVVKVEVVGAAGRLGLGSGVVVADTKVITNCHVTRNATSIRVGRGVAQHDVKRTLNDMARDLCLLHVPSLRLPAAPLAADDALQPGQPLLAVGYTAGTGPGFSGGDVVALHAHDGASVIQSSNSFNSGASGGGLFSAQGRLVGVLTFRLRGALAQSAHYYSAPVAWVNQLLQAPLERYEDVAAVAGKAYWELPRAEQARFLQATAAHAAQDWPALLSLCEAWTREEPLNPQAWGLLGTAYLRLGRRDECHAVRRRLQGMTDAEGWALRLGRDLEGS
jgi:serine protease Do